MIDLEEFQAYLIIDRNSLDTELQHQAELLYKIGEAHVTAIATRDNLKEAVASTDASLDAQIRAEGEDKKLTEPQIKAAIQAHPKHRKAQASYADAKALSDKLGVLKDSMKDRGFMLRTLCELYISRYYEENSVQGTNSTDTAAYRQIRKRTSDLRDARDRGRG